MAMVCKRPVKYRLTATTAVPKRAGREGGEPLGCRFGKPGACLLYSLTFGSLSGLLPVMGQEFLDALGRMGRDALEHVRLINVNYFLVGDN